VVKKEMGCDHGEYSRDNTKELSWITDGSLNIYKDDYIAEKQKICQWGCSKYCSSEQTEVSYDCTNPAAVAGTPQVSGSLVCVATWTDGSPTALLGTCLNTSDVARARVEATYVACDAAPVAGNAGAQVQRHRKCTTRTLFSSGDPESLTEGRLTRPTAVPRDPGTVISVVSDYFTALQTPDSEFNLLTVPWELDLDPCTTAKPACAPARLSNRITRDQVAATIARSPKRRAPGPDGLLGDTLRCAPSAAVDLIARLQTEY